MADTTRRSPEPLLGSACSPRAGPFAPLFFANRLPEAVSCAAELGYGGLELSLKSGEEAKECGILQRLASVGLRITAIASGRFYHEDGLSLDSPDPEKRQEAVRRLRGVVELAAGVGAGVVIGSVRGSGAFPDAKDRSVAELAV